MPEPPASMSELPASMPEAATAESGAAPMAVALPNLAVEAWTVPAATRRQRARRLRGMRRGCRQAVYQPCLVAHHHSEREKPQPSRATHAPFQCTCPPGRSRGRCSRQLPRVRQRRQRARFHRPWPHLPLPERAVTAVPQTQQTSPQPLASRPAVGASMQRGASTHSC